MPRTRNEPKWLAFTVPIWLSPALSGTMGCSSDAPVAVTQPPVYSREAGVANITVPRGVQEPAFNSSVGNYSALLHGLDTASVNVAVALKDTKAKLRINGLSSASGQAAAVSVNNGVNAITITTIFKRIFVKESAYVRIYV